TLGLGLALAAAVLPARRPPLVIAGWSAAVAGLLAATVISRVSVTPAGGGPPAAAWPGVALALAALGLLVAAAPAAQRLIEVAANGDGFLSAADLAPATAPGRARRLLAGAALIGAATAPLFVAAFWVKDGVRGPVAAVSAPLLPAFVSASSASGQQYRTLVLRPDPAQPDGLDYSVVRQSDPTLGEPELGVSATAGAALSRVVAALAAPDGADAGDPGLVLGDFGLRYVLLPGPVSGAVAQRLDAAVGLLALSKAPTYDLWQVAGPVARARVVAADGTVTALTSASNAANVTGAAVPATGGTLVLAEPYGGWTAKLNGHPLKPVAGPVTGWAQGFVLPAGGGTLSVTRDNLARTLSLLLELIAVLAVFVLALPGRRTDPVQEAAAIAALREARNGRRAPTSAPRSWRGLRAGARLGTRIASGTASHRAAGGPDLAESPGEGAPGADERRPPGTAGAEPADYLTLAGTSVLAQTDANPPAAAAPTEYTWTGDAWVGVGISDLDAGRSGRAFAGESDAVFPRFPESPLTEAALPEEAALEGDLPGSDVPGSDLPRDDVPWGDLPRSGVPWDALIESALAADNGSDAAVPAAADAYEADAPLGEDGAAAGPVPAGGEPGTDHRPAAEDPGSHPAGATGDDEAAPAAGAPWDTAGDWGNTGRSSTGWDSKPTAWGDATVEDPGQHDDSVRPTGAQPTFTPTGPQPTFTPTGPQPRFRPSGPQPAFHPTGQHPVVPDDPAETPAPFGIGSGRLPGESGPQSPVPPETPPPRNPWYSGPQATQGIRARPAVPPAAEQPAADNPPPVERAPWEVEDPASPADPVAVPAAP
ncbi:MAG TPA: hypothetical protein VGD91_27985, partial [Trebonia sp.]